jgi:hypothetical protein
MQVQVRLRCLAIDPGNLILVPDTRKVNVGNDVASRNALLTAVEVATRYLE